MIQFLGGGQMAAALIGGLIASGIPSDEIIIVERLPARRDKLGDLFAGALIVDSPMEVFDRAPAPSGANAGTAASSPGQRSDSDRPGLVGGGTVVAVKPQDAEAALRGVGPGLGTVLSIMAGVATSTIEHLVGADVPVLRAMPNTPALVGRGASALAGGRFATEVHMSWARGVLRSVGTVVDVPESQLDAVTALSGSGPAYMFLVLEALVDAAVAAGLKHDVATTLAVQTMAGSAALAAASDEPLSALRAQVTSPGGTTAAGLRALEAHGVRAAFDAAVTAAAQRSRELAG